MFDPSKLSGIWEGESRPFRKERESTGWSECALKFTRESVSGEGYSTWRGERIRFTITGAVDLEEGSFDIVKKHTGKYNNSIRYKGKIDQEKLEIQGQYRSGNLILLKTKPRFVESKTSAPLSLLSGAWKGDYRGRRNNETTVWHDCHIDFSIINGEGMISGNGTHLYQNKVFPFSISGVFDLKASSVVLYKIHAGPYKNVSYRLRLDLERLQMDGEDADGMGVLHLQKVRIVSNNQNSSAPSKTETVDVYSPFHFDDSTRTKPETELSNEIPLKQDIQPGAEGEIYNELNNSDVARSSPSSRISGSGSQLTVEFRGDEQQLSPPNSPSSPSPSLSLLSSSNLSLKSSQRSSNTSSNSPLPSSSDSDHPPPPTAPVSGRKESEGEDEVIKDSELCKVCMDARIDCVIMPCFHMATCMTCSKQLQNCPLCRVPIGHVHYVFKG